VFPFSSLLFFGDEKRQRGKRTRSTGVRACQKHDASEGKKESETLGALKVKHRNAQALMGPER
jgi:hypothetical protein